MLTQQEPSSMASQLDASWYIYVVAHIMTSYKRLSSCITDFNEIQYCVLELNGHVCFREISEE